MTQTRINSAMFDDIPQSKVTGLTTAITNLQNATAKLNIRGTDVASASTVNLTTATGDYVLVTGTTTITAITLADGQQQTVRFAGVLTLTHGASLILPGTANITTAAGDVAVFRGEASGVVRCVLYQRATGESLVGGLSVRADATQSLTASQRQTARANILASSAGALAYQNIVVNGEHRISQENADNAVTGDDVYTTDQWLVDRNGTMATSVQRNAGGPDGFTHFLRLTVTTAQASLGAGDFVLIRQPIERWRIRPLALGTASARESRMGIWVRSSLTGTYTMTLRNWSGSAVEQAFLGTVTIAAANTWTFVSFSIPARTTGTWGASDTARAADIVVALAAGSNFTNTAGWVAADDFAVTVQTNLAGTLSATFDFTGVFLLPGTDAPTSDLSWMLQRQFDDELRLCQRYFEKSYPIDSPVGTATTAGQLVGQRTNTSGNFGGMIVFNRMAVKRTTPAMTAYSPSGAANRVQVNGTVDSTGYALSANGDILSIHNNGALSGVGDYMSFQFVANARM